MIESCRHFESCEVFHRVPAATRGLISEVGSDLAAPVARDSMLPEILPPLSSCQYVSSRPHRLAVRAYAIRVCIVTNWHPRRGSGLFAVHPD